MKNIDWNKVRAWIGERSKFIVVIAIFVFVVVLLLPSRHSSPSPSPHRGSDSNPQISGSLSVVPKSSPSDSDLIVEHHYKAIIDGETVNIPVRVVSSPSYSDSDGNGSVNGVNPGVTATYKQELDLTPLLSDYEHKTNWEIGVGVGSHDGDVYFPVSIQRNLSHDRAVEGVVHVSDSGEVNGGEVLYKHRF